MKDVTVALTSTGPSPKTVTISAGPTAQLLFVNTDSVTHSVVFSGGHCSFEIPPGEPAVGENPCEMARVHTYRYTVDGTFPGTIHVVGLFRSLTMTARTHAIRLGGRVTLVGRLTISNEGAPYCLPRESDPQLVLARHDAGQRFSRIAMFPMAGRPHSKRAVDNRCTYSWQRTFRPGRSTTYIAKTFGGLVVFKPAASRPVTVRVRS